MKRNAIALMMAIIMAVVLAACGKESANPKVELTISAAASLTDALNELKEGYEKEHPGVTLLFNYGASGSLQQQIEQGAPADLFLSAATKNMDALVERGLIDEKDRTNLLSNELVLVTPEGKGDSLGSVQDLLSDEVGKLAIGIPESVPAGAYAKEALTNAGLWEQLQDKSVQAKDVRQVLQYVETGNVDAGFVYRSDALQSESKTDIAFAADPGSYKPILYPIGMIKANKHEKQARELYDYLQTEEALNLFVKYGFSLPNQP
ncbi:molybdate ABC transporter substrate-binding protein [Paenibacillus pinisoli]|uniref:Molybdate ABC transporter substrate-binding protein n=1 Tax=Paenibacillus pinisoli TaxID=1276110 RepID=A0A3A6PTH3_9BACL|nr:molybdate ABC transporter substrate-binding protein [Paenibacillus pinisoli]RJX39043.1 molybdate ABC transporter substrate-binding protein [Paenibacillus pinisoli]